MKGNYMAYVGSYSYTGKAKGISVYDVDVAQGTFTKRCEVDVDNSSYVIASRDGKTLYSIADEGVVSFRILQNGSLSRIGTAKTKGMRGCHLATDEEGKYIFVSGYHDGKSTILRINDDGSVGDIVDGVYHKGLGSVAERTFRPHVSCTRRTPDGKYIMVADLGIDQVKIYRFNEHDEKLVLVDAIRCDLQSAPRRFIFSADGKFIYLMYQQKNVIDVFTYKTGDRVPAIEKVQTISTTGSAQNGQLTAACSMRFSGDQKHLFCGNAGDNTVNVYRRDEKSGLLESLCCLPISGDYPKDIAIFPDNQHLAAINHDSNSITFFHINYDSGLLVMSSKQIPVNQPNCCTIVKVGN